MGRNHHKSFYNYILGEDIEYFLDRAYSFIKDTEHSVIKYARIRAGLCHWSFTVDYELQEDINKSDFDTKRLKHLRGELSSAINKLDTYMQIMIDYSYLM